MRATKKPAQCVTSHTSDAENADYKRETGSRNEYFARRVRVAHASRVLVAMFSPQQAFLFRARNDLTASKKFAIARLTRYPRRKSASGIFANQSALSQGLTANQKQDETSETRQINVEDLLMNLFIRVHSWLNASRIMKMTPRCLSFSHKIFNPKHGAAG